MSPAELAGAILGTLFATVGLAAVAAAALRVERRDRSLVWFGLFTLLYGVRLALRSEVIRAVAPLPAGAAAYIEMSITYFILTPGVLLTAAVFDGGWRGTLKVLWKVTLAGAVAAFSWDVATGRPGDARIVNTILVVVCLAAGAVSAVAHYRAHGWTRPGWIVLGGAIVFGVVALDSTLFPGRFGRVDVEPLAMLVLIVCLAYAIVDRAFRNDRRLAAVGRELETARRIQASILPQHPPAVAGLEVAFHYDAMSEVAGDFFDFVVTRSGRLGVLVADVSGHGVPAALVASMVKIALATQGDDVEDPAEVLSRMNRALCGRFELAYVTAVFALIDPDARTLAYASAGHPPPILMRRSVAERLDGHDLILGLIPDATYATTVVRDLSPGDRVLFYTDGLTEAARADGEFFGDRQLDAALVARRADPIATFTASLAQAAEHWSGADFADDVTMVTVELTIDD